MPLRDGVYERAKCGYKLLQYAAAGIVAVGDPVGVNREILERSSGFAPEDPDEWADALDAAVTLTDADRQLRRTAAAVVAAAYSFDAWEPAWRSAVGLDERDAAP